MVIDYKNKRYVRYKDGAQLYSVSQSTFERLAKEAGAVSKVGKTALVNCEILNRYIDSFRLPPE